MVIALLLAISAISLTGYMMTTDTFWGVGWVEDVHEVSVYATLGLIALHVAGRHCRKFRAQREPCAGHVHRPQRR
jgi:cytochrome b